MLTTQIKKKEEQKPSCESLQNHWIITKYYLLVDTISIGCAFLSPSLHCFLLLPIWCEIMTIKLTVMITERNVDINFKEKLEEEWWFYRCCLYTLSKRSMKHIVMTAKNYVWKKKGLYLMRWSGNPRIAPANYFSHIYSQTHFIWTEILSC